MTWGPFASSITIHLYSLDDGTPVRRVTFEGDGLKAEVWADILADLIRDLQEEQMGVPVIGEAAEA